MKYRQLSKEQLLELHEDFAKFLATQQITENEWIRIKKEKPSVAMEELNVFSDMVWEDVLTKITYLEHISDQHMNLFKCSEETIDRIYVQLNDKTKSFLNENDFNWFLEDLQHVSVEYFTASKKYQKERNLERFELIEKGSQITKGGLYEAVRKAIT